MCVVSHRYGLPVQHFKFACRNFKCFRVGNRGFVARRVDYKAVIFVIGRDVEFRLSAVGIVYRYGNAGYRVVYAYLHAVDFYAAEVVRNFLSQDIIAVYFVEFAVNNRWVFKAVYNYRSIVFFKGFIVDNQRAVFRFNHAQPV